MSLLEKIKTTIFGETPPPRPRTEEENDDQWLGTQQSTTGYRPDVSTPADDPVLDDIAAAGVQPLSKPAGIEEAQNPVRRRLDEDD